MIGHFAGLLADVSVAGKTARIIRNKFTEYWAAHEEDIKPFPYQLREVGEPASVRGRMEGDIEHGVLAAGQGSGSINAALGLARGEDVDQTVWIPFQLVVPSNMSEYTSRN